MKINLNHHILDSKTYCKYIFENVHLKHTTDYIKFVSLCSDDWHSRYPNLIHQGLLHNIDVYPYLYTLEIILDNEREAFFRFFSNYLSQTESETQYHIDFINMDSYMTNAEMLAIFIISMQYFFL